MIDRGGFHEDFSRQEKVKGSSDRTFGLVFALFFGVLGAVAFWKQNPHWIWWAVLAAVTLIIALRWPGLLKPVNKLWTMLGLLLFKIISPITLGVIYYGVMTPMSLFLRWRNKDILRLKYDPQATSYWIQRDPPGPEPESMKNQF
jgi:hypothetical protein